MVDVVAFPDNVPENVVAVTVLVDGLIVTVDTVDVAAPVKLPEAGVNITGWFVFVVAATTLTLVPVVANPANVPLKVVDVSVAVLGLYVKPPVEVAAPDTEPEAVV